MAKLTKKLMEALTAIVAAGANGMFTSPAVHKPLVKEGFVEINPSMTNDDGIATRATQAGIDFLSPAAGSEFGNEETAAGSASNFVLEDSVPVPAASGRGRTANTYPFDKMEVGQSFFVPNTEKKPNAAKSLASTVSSATNRYAVPKEPAETRTNRKGREVPVMVETRKFIVRSVEENGVAGARVWRTK